MKGRRQIERKALNIHLTTKKESSVRWTLVAFQICFNITLRSWLMIPKAGSTEMERCYSCGGTLWRYNWRSQPFPNIFDCRNMILLMIFSVSNQRCQRPSLFWMSVRIDFRPSSIKSDVHSWEELYNALFPSPSYYGSPKNLEPFIRWEPYSD